MRKVIALPVSLTIDEQGAEHYVVLLDPEAAEVFASYLEAADTLAEMGFVNAASQNHTDLMANDGIYAAEEVEKALQVSLVEEGRPAMVELPEGFNLEPRGRVASLNLIVHQTGDGEVEVYSIGDTTLTSDFFDRDDLAAIKRSSDHG